MAVELAVHLLFRADSRIAHSQWETLLQSNTVSHWLGANLEPWYWARRPIMPLKYNGQTCNGGRLGKNKLNGGFPQWKLNYSQKDWLHWNVIFHSNNKYCFFNENSFIFILCCMAWLLALPGHQQPWHWLWSGVVFLPWKRISTNSHIFQCGWVIKNKSDIDVSKAKLSMLNG